LVFTGEIDGECISPVGIAAQGGAIRLASWVWGKRFPHAGQRRRISTPSSPRERPRRKVRALRASGTLLTATLTPALAATLYTQTLVL
jgi:hypothetical protein